MCNVDDGRQGVDGIREVMRKVDGREGFREEDRVVGLEGGEAEGEEVAEGKEEDAKVLEKEKERWRVTLSRPRYAILSNFHRPVEQKVPDSTPTCCLVRSRASWLMVKDGEASRAVTPMSLSLGSSMAMTGTGVVSVIMDATGVSMVTTGGFGGAGLGMGEAVSLVNLTMSRGCSRDMARSRAESLAATAGGSLGGSESMSRVWGEDSASGGFNRMGVESRETWPGATRAATAEEGGGGSVVSFAGEEGRGGEQGDRMTDAMPRIVPFRRGDGGEEKENGEEDGGEGLAGGDGGGSSRVQQEADVGGGGASVAVGASQVMRVSSSKPGGGGLVRGSSSRTLQYVMALSLSPASSRTSTAAGGGGLFDSKARGWGGTHEGLANAGADVRGVDGGDDDSYPEEGVDEIRCAAELRMRERMLVIEETKRDGNVLFEAGR